MPLSPLSTSKPGAAASGKYLQLSEHFASRIHAGQLRSGERFPTFVQLQQQFGVTANTVNRALIDLEQKGLIVRERRRGVFVADAIPAVAKASSAAKGSTPFAMRGALIGLAGFGFRFSGRSSYWAALLEGVQEAATQRGSQLLLLDFESTTGWEKADGLLICDWAHQLTVPHVSSQIPCVSVLVPVPDMASVYVDDYAAARGATEHLLELGHRRIAYLHERPYTITARRLAGYKDALKAAGIAPQQQWRRRLPGIREFGNDFVKAGYEGMKRWLHGDWRETGCTALLCQNDETAVGAMTAIREAGLSTPSDVSVVGFDGMQIGTHISPRLTTIEMPLREIGARAIEMLSRQIEADEVMAEHQILNTRLRARESTATPPRH